MGQATKRNADTARAAIRAALRIAVAALGLWFCAPIPFGVANIGTVTGILMCGVVSAALSPEGTRLYRRAGRGVRLAVRAGAAVLLCAVALAAVESGFMLRGARRNSTGTETVLVLGCKVRGREPSRLLLTRLDAALRHLRAHPRAVCIVSGGKGADERLSEAACMARWLTGHGIAAERIFLETESTSTRENLAFSATLAETLGLPPDVAIVTNEFHQYRAAFLARRAGLVPAAIPAHTPLWALPAYWVRELYAVLHDWVRAGDSERISV